jgi:hypothetical protein
VRDSLPEGAPGDPVLSGVDGQKLSVYTERLFRKLGIADASFHSLRHPAASWLVMNGKLDSIFGEVMPESTAPAGLFEVGS